MTFEPSIARRVARLENDRDSLYELLDDFRAETRTRFDQHEARFDGIDARFDQVDARFDRIEGSLAEVLRRLPEVS